MDSAAVTTIWTGIVSTVAAGALVAAASAGWRYLRPAFNIRVSRRQYLARILKESTNVQVQGIDLLAGVLKSAVGNKTLTQLQDAWGQVAARGEVRALAEGTDDNLKAACELYERGVQVRLLSMNREIELLSFHIFRTKDAVARVVLNQKGKTESADQPAVFDSAPMARILTDSFMRLWPRATTVPNLLVEKIEGTSSRTSKPPSSQDLDSVLKTYTRDPRLADAVRAQLSLRFWSRFVFVVGPPGAGKSTARKLLAEKLRKRGHIVDEITDYPYLYEAFIKDAVVDNSTVRFEADGAGGFRLRDPAILSSAVGAISAQAVSALEQGHLAVVEFARPNLMQSLGLFDARVRAMSQVIYLTASPEGRRARITGRSQRPSEYTDGYRVSLELTDNHPVADAVLNNLYAEDDGASLRTDPKWGTRTLFIDTENDARTVDQLSERLDQFIANQESRFPRT